MKEFAQITFFEFKMIIRTKLNYVLLPILLYFLYYSIYDGVTNLTLSGYVLQILILGAMIISYQSFKQEYIQGYEELLQVIGKRYILNSARLFANCIFMTLINAMILGITIIYGFYQNQPEWIIHESVKYIILYFYISSIISIVIGGSIASVIKNKLGYALLIFVGICIGPLGKGVCEAIATILNINNLNDFINAINIGQYDIYEGFNFLYGFEIESGRFIHRGIYLLSLLCVFYIIKGLKEKKEQLKYITTIACTVIVLLPLVNITRYPIYIYKPGIIGDDAKGVHDYLFYQNSKITYEKPSFLLSKVKAIVDTRKALAVKGDFFIRISENTNRINFTLYRDFRIKEISFDDQKLSYKQEGDNIMITLPEFKKKGDEICLEIEYEGLSSNYFFSGEKAVLLPTYFNWLPFPGKTSSMYMENSLIKTSPLYINTPVSYDIDVKCHNKIASNIPSNTNHIIGTSSDGVSLISGYLYYIENDFRYYYTNNIPVEEMQTYTKQLLKYINMVENDLGIKETKIKQAFFAPFKEEYLAMLDTNYVVNSLKVGDTLFTSSYPEVNRLTDEHYIYEAVACIFNSNIDFGAQDVETKTKMISAYVDCCVRKCNVKTEFSNKIPEDVEYWIERCKKLSW